jgi:lipopolysaccharide transport system permease protein
MFSARKLCIYKDLIIHKSIADFRRDSERTYMGIVWWVLEPILYMSIYYVIFKIFLQIKVENFVPYLLTGLVGFQWFSNSIARAGNSILTNAPLVQQVQFSNIIFPIIAILTATLQSLISFGVLLIILWAFGLDMGIFYLSLPIVLFIEFLFILGCSLVLSAVIPFIPDIYMLIPHIIRIIFYFSAIMYSVTNLPEKAQFFLQFNPMLQIVAGMRDSMMYARWPSWEPLVIITFFSVCAIFVGAFLIFHNDTIYAKRITR